MKYLLTTLCFGILVSSGFSQTMKSLMYNTSGVVTYTNTNALAFTNAVTFSNIQDASSVYKLDLSQGSFIYETNIVASWIGNAFAFAVPIEFFNNAEATTRTNLGLGASWLTNNSVTDFCTAIGLGSINDVTFNSVRLAAGGSVGWTAGVVSLGSISLTNSSITFKYGTTPAFSANTNSITLLAPNSALAFSPTNTNGAAITRTNLGLGGGITTNRSFISYDGTNYTTNTVTISNGIITGWTQ